MGHRDAGIQLYEAFEYEKAILHLTKAIEANPEDAEAHYRRACSRLHLIERDSVAPEETIRQVLQDLDRAIEISPDDYRVYYARAMTYAGMARYKESVSDLLVCIQSKDRNLRPKAHRRIGQIYDEKFEEMQAAALRHYEAYLQMGGNDPQVVTRVTDLKRAELERGTRSEEGPAQLLQVAHQLAAEGKHQEAFDLAARLLGDPYLPKDTLHEARELFVRERMEVEAERKAETLLETASGLIRDGKRDAARAVLEELTKKYPSTEAARTKAPALMRSIEQRNP
jgi:tetratricopeptide (TPR) repeat protein